MLRLQYSERVTPGLQNEICSTCCIRTTVANPSNQIGRTKAVPRRMSEHSVDVVHVAGMVDEDHCGDGCATEEIESGDALDRG